MTRLRGGLASGGLVVLLAAAASAQSYGPDLQLLTIGAAEFQPLFSAGSALGSDGYLSFSSQESYLAPVNLPVGARIHRFCLYAYDAFPDRSLDAALIAAKLVPGGESSAVYSFAVFADSADEGYGVVCRQVDHTLEGKVDVDGDDTLDHVAYYILADVSGGGKEHLGLGGVRLTWERPVSPPPPTPTFGDVPASDPAFSHVEALSASGITAGCAGGNFCPNATLTRRQMAVFLAKALGLHWPN